MRRGEWHRDVTFLVHEYLAEKTYTVEYDFTAHRRRARLRSSEVNLGKLLMLCFRTFSRGLDSLTLARGACAGRDGNLRFVACASRRIGALPTHSDSYIFSECAGAGIAFRGERILKCAAVVSG